MTTIDDGPPRTSPKPIEAVARAVYEQRNGFGAFPWSRHAGAHKQPYRSDASAAIITLISLGYITQAGIAAFKDEKGKDE